MQNFHAGKAPAVFSSALPAACVWTPHRPRASLRVRYVPCRRKEKGGYPAMRTAGRIHKPAAWSAALPQLRWCFVDRPAYGHAGPRLFLF